SFGGRFRSGSNSTTSGVASIFERGEDRKRNQKKVTCRQGPNNHPNPKHRTGSKLCEHHAESPSSQAERTRDSTDSEWIEKLFRKKSYTLRIHSLSMKAAVTELCGRLL